MRKTLDTRQKELLLLCAAFLLYIIRYAVFGFTYYPLLDDHIQYYWYANISDVLHDVFSEIRNIAQDRLRFFDRVCVAACTIHRSVLILSSCISVSGIYFLKWYFCNMGIQCRGTVYLVCCLMPIGMRHSNLAQRVIESYGGKFFAALSMVIF